MTPTPYPQPDIKYVTKHGGEVISFKEASCAGSIYNLFDVHYEIVYKDKDGSYRHDLLNKNLKCAVSEALFSSATEEPFIMTEQEYRNRKLMRDAYPISGERL